MSRLTFNRQPYFDDYSSSKNFMKVLFRPGRPVQTRELNQIQSIFQNQIERFANHIFKNGSRVSAARAALSAKAYVRLKEISPWDSATVDLSPYPDGMTVIGMTSGITARLVKTVNAEFGDPPTIYVVYTGVSIDGETHYFIPGEVLRFYDTNNVPVYSVTVRCPGCVGSAETDTIPVTGVGQIFYIDEGIFYYEGMFIENSSQNVIVSKYGEDANCKIGFDFVQTILTSNDDSTLLDNALGYPNLTAPGADRYQVELSLVVRSLNAEDGENYILLALVDNGRFRYLKADSEYSEIMDMIAKRTYETNGNFTVNPFKVRFIEDKAIDANDPNGYSVDGDEDYVRAIISGGISYVKGYRFENSGDIFLKARKARDTRKTATFIKRFEERTSINLKPLKGYSALSNKSSTAPVLDDTIVTMYDGPFDGGKNVTGNPIGTFRVFDTVFVSGVINSDVTPAVFKYYIYDLNLNSGKKMTDAQSFIDSTTTNGFKAVPENASVTLYNPGRTELLWRLDRDNIKSLRSIADSGNPNPPGSTTIVLRKKMIGTINDGGITFNSAFNEYFMPYSQTNTVAVIIDTDQGAGLARTIDLTGKTAVTSNTFTVTLGNTVDVGTGTPLSTSGKTICVLHDIMRTNATEDTMGTNFVQVDVLVRTTNMINLGVTDAYEIEYVKAFNASAPSLPDVDITSDFTLYPNKTDCFYNESQIKYTGAAYTADANIYWKYRVKYRTHDNSQHFGYYTVDSYKDLIADDEIEYASNPTYTAINKNEYPLFGSFDFRPDLLGGSLVGYSVPSINSTATFDLEYYLPRTDLLCVDKDSRLYLKEGVPSETPAPPKPDDGAMTLYEIYFPSYTYSPADIKVKYIENKRYTMRDIGKIDERVKVVEYYTALNLLEKSAKDMSIKDQNGLDRFKNGFIADNFQEFQAGDINNSDFKAALDTKQRELRPQFTPRNKKIQAVVANSDAKFVGKVAIIDYDSVQIDEQPYATKHISINPYFQFKRSGTMVLMPNTDVWTDTTRLPDLVVNVDTGVDAFAQLADATKVLGTKWGTWKDLNRTVVQDTTTETNAKGIKVETTTTTTTTQQQKTGTVTTVGSRTDSYDMGDRVTDVSLNPWMRETEITFFATKLTGNTKVWAFFDRKPVTEYVRPLKGSPGEQLITDASGQLAGVFNVPGGMFHTGDRVFLLTTDKDLTGDADAEWASASATFFSGGLDVTKQKTTMNVTTPTLDIKNVVDNRTVTDVKETSTGECPDIPEPGEQHGPGSKCWVWDPTSQSCWQRCTCCNFCPNCQDPVAQGFKLDHDYFVTGFDVYFQTADTATAEDLFFQIRTMNNGYPTSVVLGEKKHSTLEIEPFVSEDSKTAFHVEFDLPIYVQGGVSYCLVVGGFSPNTRIWVARLGQTIVDQPGKILETQPSLQSSFRSQNAETWNAEQFEDIKYKLYGAKFKKRSLDLQFEHIPDRTALGRDPFEGELDSSRLRVYAMDHGLLAGDKVTISLLEDNWIEIDIPEGAGQMQVGMNLRTDNNSLTATVSDYKTDQVHTFIKLKNIKGGFTVGQHWICEQMDWAVHDNFLITQMGYQSDLIQGNGVVRFNQVSGTFVSGPPAPVNGFTFDQLSKQHIVVEVDSIDTFIIQIPGTTATVSGRFGGEAGYIQINEKYEVFNVAGSYLAYGSTENWQYHGIGHNPINGPFQSQDYQAMEPKEFKVGNDMFLGQPHKMVSADNLGSGGRLVTVNASFTAPTEWITPVINTDTFSITTISNRVEWITAEQLGVEPNALGRYRSESDPMNGSENYKYVTKAINLKNPASDLVIAFDVYKDINADFDLWIKRVAPYEGVDIDTKRWMRVVGIEKNHHSVDLTDRVEYELTLSKLQVEEYSTDTIFTVKDWDDLADDEFSSFKIKIVGRAKNPATPPLFQSFRAIAVT